MRMIQINSQFGANWIWFPYIAEPGFGTEERLIAARDKAISAVMLSCSQQVSKGNCIFWQRQLLCVSYTSDGFPQTCCTVFFGFFSLHPALIKPVFTVSTLSNKGPLIVLGTAEEAL